MTYAVLALLLVAAFAVVLVAMWPILRVARLLFIAMTAEERILAIVCVFVIFWAAIAVIAALTGLI
jgi:hypothetical protein